ncbi:MAG TPA: DUF4191 domain-containing protein [Actinocrinis sp.]|uniref:DUF4191 domain-containing protein n=1 Tax=Actinocrinis sp. TaxID=1920516 RepID=UPI002DDC9155|nr:DUF4191 domain-containing protein [Actinocrinis sp.]HEV2345508.1 DUF4191 domain-containing protein [Actinocrinis sp.]
MARNPSPEPTVNPAAQPEPPTGRFKQFVYAYKVTKESDPRLPLAILGFGGLTLVAVFALFYFSFGQSIFGLALGIVLGLASSIVVGLSVLSRRVQSTAYRQIEGQPGAAAAVIEQSLKRGWSMTTMVRFNRQQDLVHRLIGRAGILLVAEGDPARLTQLVKEERKAIARNLGPDVEVNVVVVGDDTEAGQIPLSKLTQTLTKRSLRGRAKLTQMQINEYSKRLAAISSGPLANMPKGPMPRGGRIPRGNPR